MKLKLNLFAAAGLLACGATLAQSSVTFYGIADAYVGQKTTGVGAAKVTRTVIDSDGLANSRWGLRGSEDLGNGLRGEFQLESLIDLSTGVTTQVTTVPAAVPGAQLFSSQAWVGIAGGFGSLKLGRQVSPFHSYVGLTNNLYDATAFSTTGSVWGLGSLPNYIGRFDHAISYESPVVGGVSGKIALGFGEDKTATLSATKNTSLNIKYAAGPVIAGYSYQKQGAQGAVLPISYKLIGGSYDFGAAKVVGAINTTTRGSSDDKDFQIGLNVPFGAASVAFGYAYSKGTVNGAAGDKGTGLALLATYDLSKRSRLYAGWRKTSNKTPAGVATVETATLGAGIIHRF